MKTTGAFLFLILAQVFISTIANAQHPESRWISLAAYDKANNRAILFGGANDKGILTDLWSLKNYKWEKLDSTGPAIMKCAFAYDANRKKIVLYGGSGEQLLMNETWEWDGRHWEKKNISGPGPRNHPMSAYDPREKAIILFGGYNNGALSDTWSYDGTSWKLLDTNGPKNCFPHGIFYDSAHSKLMLLTFATEHEPDKPNSTANQLWEWTGKSWKNIPGGSVYTSGRSLQALSQFDNSGIVLFDGDDISNNHGKTWTYSNGQWNGLSVNGPGARVGHYMLYNPSTGKVTLFGGSDRVHFFDDMWEWDGHTWKEIKSHEAGVHN